MLFNIDMIDQFLECEDDNRTSYADATTSYSTKYIILHTLPCAQDISFVISELQKVAKKTFDWCKNNYMKANPGKYHVIPENTMLS